jgi:hypothetical protein
MQSMTAVGGAFLRAGRILSPGFVPPVALFAPCAAAGTVPIAVSGPAIDPS